MLYTHGAQTHAGKTFIPINEKKILTKLRQENYFEFKASLSYRREPVSKRGTNKNKPKQTKLATILIASCLDSNQKRIGIFAI